MLKSPNPKRFTDISEQMEGANPSRFPVISSVDDREEFPEDFGLYLQRELNWSRLANDGGGKTHVTGWVFWSRRDDEPRYLPVSDCGSENPDDVPVSSPKVQDKIRLALEKIILHPRFGRSLVQYWAATSTIEKRILLTTRNQPYALGMTGRSTWGLCKYRMKSMEYKFYGDIGEKGEEELGLPGRVFLHRLPESVPDVHYYSRKEYPQRDDASHCQVRASWALPVFERSRQICVGVLELVSTVDAITDWYDKSFLRNLYDVFQELGLNAIDAYKHYQMKYKEEDNALTAAFHELSLVLESVNKIHKLPLALTWVPCSACDAVVLGRLSSEGGKYLGAFKGNNNHLIDFLIANTGYHLPKGQVAERVLSFPNMLYCKDVTQFSIAEYPLVDFARHCKLSGWFTICLHSSYTGEVVYILEFFLPASSEDNENPLTTVGMILGTIKENSRTFKLASGKELGEVLSVEVFDFHNGWKSHPMQTIQASRFIPSLEIFGMHEVPKDNKKTGKMHKSKLQNDIQKTRDDYKDVLRETRVEQMNNEIDSLEWRFVDRTKDSNLQAVGRKHYASLEKPKEVLCTNKTVYNLTSETILNDAANDGRPSAEGVISAGCWVCCDLCRKWRLLPHGTMPDQLPEKWLCSMLNWLDGMNHCDFSEEETTNALNALYQLPLPQSQNHLQNYVTGTAAGAADAFHFDQSHPNLSSHAMPNRRKKKQISKGTPYAATNGGTVQISGSTDEGVILPLGQLNQPSFDAIDIGMDVSSAEEDDSVATISKGGTTKKHEREHNKTGVSFDISLKDVLRFSALNCSEAAKGLGVSKSTLKRLCREYGIYQWPPRNINKEEAFPVALPNVGDIVHLDSQEEPSLMELDAAKDGAHDLREDDSLPSMPHLENKSQPSLGVSVSTFKHISGQHGITCGPNGQNGGGAMTRPDSLDQPSMDALNDGRSLICAERNNLEVSCSEEGTIKTQKREQEKTTGVRIEISREDLLQCSEMKLGDAARRLEDGIIPNAHPLHTNSDGSWQNLLNESRLGLSPHSDVSGLGTTVPVNSGECSLMMPVNSRDQQPVDAPNRRELGRPMLRIFFDDMKRCKHMTLADAAMELGVSKSTLARRVLEVTGLKWSNFRRTAPDF